MYPVATDLADGDSLPDADEVARYCKPNDYDLEQGQPAVSAFMKRKTEIDVSVNRLQFFQCHTRKGAVGCIRLEVKKHYKLKRNGRFVVFNVADAKAVAQKKGFNINMVYTPLPGRPSHTSMIDLPQDYDDEVRVAAAIMRLITQADTYEAVL